VSKLRVAFLGSAFSQINDLNAVYAGYFVIESTTSCVNSVASDTVESARFSSVRSQDSKLLLDEKKGSERTECFTGLSPCSIAAL